MWLNSFAKVVISLESVCYFRVPEECREEELDKVCNEETSLGVSEEEITDFSRGDEVICYTGEFENNGMILPEYTIRGKVLGVDPENGKIVIKTSDGKYDVEPDRILSIPMIRCVVRKDRGTALLYLKWVIEKSMVGQVVKIVLAILAAVVLLFLGYQTQKLLLVALALIAMMLCGSNYTVLNDLRQSSYGVEVRLRAYVCFLAVAQKNKLLKEDEPQESLLSLLAQQYIFDGSNFAETLKNLSFRAEQKTC